MHIKEREYRVNASPWLRSYRLFAHSPREAIRLAYEWARGVFPKLYYEDFLPSATVFDIKMGAECTPEYRRDDPSAYESRLPQYAMDEW